MQSNKSLCLFLFLAASLGSSAQKERNPDSLVMPARHAIKVNLLQLLSFYPTIPVAYEVKVAPRLTLQPEVGYVLRFSQQYHYQNKRGVKLRAALRWYPGNMTSTKETHDYLALEPYANIINFDRYSNEEGCFDIECQLRYWQTIHRVVRYRESGLAVKWGHIMYCKHFLYDLSLGLRIRRIRYFDDASPANSGFDGDDIRFWLFQLNEVSRIAAGVVVTFSFGWKIK